MIEIAASVCLWNEPGHCRDIALTFEAETITPYSCIFYGQGELAKWAEEHPGWRVAKFTCRPAGQTAKL